MREKIVALAVILLLASPAFAFIGPGLNDLFKDWRIKLNPQPDPIEHNPPTIQIKLPNTPNSSPSPKPTPKTPSEPADSTVEDPISPSPSDEPILLPQTIPSPKSDTQIIKCELNTDCGNNQEEHSFTVNTEGLTQFDMLLTPHGTTESVSIYAKENGYYHKIAERPIIDPNEETPFTVVTNENISSVKITMPGAQSPTSETFVTQLHGGGILPTSTFTSIWSDTCNNNIGYSSNPTDSHCNGFTDCCNWYQQYHVHDMGSTINQNVSINIDFKPGSSAGCRDTVTIYTSTQPETNWEFAGSTPTQSIDTSNKQTIYQEDWATRSYTISGYDVPFRYVKVEIPRCHNDWSYVTVTDAPNNLPPTASFIVPSTTPVNAQLDFNATQSGDPDGAITNYQWQWGDGVTTSTPNAITSHTYSQTGTYTVSLIVKDNGKASDDAQKQFTLTTEVIDNTSPTVSITQPLNTTLTTNQVLINWDASDSGSGVKNHTLTITGATTLTSNHEVNNRSYSALLNEGSHTVTVKTYDYSGNSATDSVMFTVDLPAPSVTITAPLEHSYHNEKVNIQWTGSTNVAYYTVNETNVSTNTSIEVNPGDGTYTYIVTAHDGFSNTDSDTIMFTIDTTKPIVNINSPTHNSILNNNNVTIEWTGSDTVSGIKYYTANETNVSTSTSKNLELTDGNYTYTITAYDYSGNHQNTTIDFSIETSAPIISITSHSNNTATNNPQMEYDGYDSTGIAYYEVKHDNTAWINNSLNTDYTFTLTDGPYQWYVRGTDSLGNTGTPTMINITLDTTGPQLTITGPANNTATNNKQMNYTGNDPAGIAYYEIKHNNTPWINNSLSESYTFSLTDGTYQWYVRGTDSLGNTGTPTMVNITLDTIAPDLNILGPNNNSYWDTGELGIFYTTSATDIDTYYQKLNNGPWIEDTDGSPSVFWNMSDGIHYMYAKIVDKAGNEVTGYTYINMDANSPTLNIVSPSNNTEYNQNWVVVTFNTTHEDINTIEYAKDAGSWYDTGITEINKDTNYTYNFTTLNDGVNKLRIRAKDHSSKTGNETFVNVNITTTPNTPPITTITKPLNETDHLFLDEIKFKYTDTQTTSLNCSYSINTGNWNELTVNNNTEETQAITNITNDGQHNVSVKCFDGTHWSTISHVFYVDNASPVISITSHSNNTATNNPQMEYDGYDPAGIAYYEIKHNNTAWINNGLNTDYTFSLTDGPYQWYVRGTDSLGNTGTPTMVNITLDTIAPDLTIIGPANNSNWTGPNTGIFYTTTATDVDTYYQKLDNGPWIEDPNGISSAFYNVSDGTHYVYVKIVDYAGNEVIGSIYVNIDSHGPTTVVTSPLNNANFTVDDVNFTFYSNDSDIDRFQYSFDGSSWTNAITGATSNTSYTTELNNIPEGANTVYIRGVDDTNSYGAAEEINVNIDSLFTNLKVSLGLPGSIIVSTPFEVLLSITNDNEETISFGNIQANLSSTCSISESDPNPQAIWEIEGNGDTERGTWIVDCSQVGTASFTGFMIYLPDNRTKSDTQTLGVTTMSSPSGGEGTVIDLLGIQIDLTKNEIKLPI